MPQQQTCECRDNCARGTPSLNSSALICCHVHVVYRQRFDRCPQYEPKKPKEEPSPYGD